MGRTARIIPRVALVTAVTAAGAWISIPLPGGIALSLQLVGVLAGGLILGPIGGGLAQAAYVTLGIAGAPVFAGFQAGMGVLAGPSGGFLLGFVAGAVVCGAMSWDRRLPSLIAAALAGLFTVYLCGMGGLMLWMRLSVHRAMLAVAVFAPVDLLKVILVVALVCRLDRMRLTGR